MMKVWTFPIAAAALLALVSVGCSKKVAVNAPPAPAKEAPAAAAPAPAPRPAATQPAPARAAAVTPAPRVPDAKTKARIDELLARIEDAYFDYDQATLRPDAIKALTADATELRDIISQYPDYKLTIEGHCDERGSAEYNMALGDKRAAAAKNFLVQVGISDNQLSVISYGKERPVCDDHDETCWQKNRRIHIVAMAR